MADVTRSQFDGVAGAEHVPTVYVAHGKQVLEAHGGVVAQTTSALEAERLAACANACSGIPTRELEAGILGDLFAACEREAPERIRAVLNRLRRF